MALSPVLGEQSTYPFVRLEQAKRDAAARGIEIIDFGQGDPREPTDPLIRQALADSVTETMGYPKAEGLPELRAAIAGWVARRFGVELDPDRELIPTLGSKEAIFSFAQVFVDIAGGRDIVLVPDPAYPVYERGAEFAGAAIVRLPLREDSGFLPDLDLDVELLDRTALMWVNYPNNPTAAVAPRAFYEQLATLAARHDFLVCSDEAYSELWFDEPPASALEPADRSHAVVFNTLSKRSSMTGYRSGFVAGPPWVIDALRKYRPTVGTAPQEFVQRASIVAWGRRGARRAGARRLPAQARRAAACVRGPWLAGCGQGRHDVPLACAARRRGLRGRCRAPARARHRRRPRRVPRPGRRGLRARRARADGRRLRASGGDSRRAGVTDAARVEEIVAALDRGERRVADKVDGEWIVDEDAKQAILDYFRVRAVEPEELGPFEYTDKIPLKHGHAERGVRVVPGAVVRYGSFLGEGVIVMPGFVNIGAWVGPGTMVDTWATVGSCAQIGANVHLAGGAGIGGVLEPVNARPVIVEDDAFIGSRAIVVEGVIVGEGAVIAPHVSLTASVPIIDVTGDEPVEHRGYVPPRSVVVPGTRPKDFPAGTYQVGCALIIGRRSESTDSKLSLNETLREFGIGAA